MAKTAIILIYRPDVDVNPGQRHGQHPFEGIEIIAVEEATGGDYEDIIAPFRVEHPNAQFHIEEV